MKNKEIDNFIDLCRALDPKPKLETNDIEMSQEDVNLISTSLKEINNLGTIFVTKKYQIESDIQKFDILALQSKEENRPIVISVQKNRRTSEKISISDVKDFWSTNFNMVL